MNWAHYLLERAGQLPDLEAGVVAGSTPVVSFGDSTVASVATLGINPSPREFLDGTGRLLEGPDLRLATLASLGVERYEDLTVDHATAIVDGCARYFDRRPYRWFDPLEEIVHGALGASYRDRSACHVDLVQWATSPTWGELPPDVQDQLLRNDVGFLRRQLGQPNLRVILVNGRSALTRASAAGLVTWQRVAVLTGPPTADLVVGRSSGPLFVGWSCNLQSQHGAGRHLGDLVQFVAEQLPGRATTGAVPAITPTAPDVAPQPRRAARATRPRRIEADAGYIERGLRFADKADLVSHLERWLEESDSPTIGDIGNYGGKAWVTVDSGVGTINLNSDTKREAVEAFVTDARARSDDLAWIVIENSRSRRTNKVLFAREEVPTPGWYAYLATPFDGPGPVQVKHRVSQPRMPNRSAASDIDLSGPRQRSRRAGMEVPAVRSKPLVPTSTAITTAASGTAAIVHFPHPGDEHIPPRDLMPWNRGNHRRKFLVSPGTYVDLEGRQQHDELVFWGEWEPQSRVIERWPPRPGVPTVLHEPHWSPPSDVDERQNTDPWVFGDTFRYSNCKQVVSSTGSPTSLQALTPGALVLFGSTPGGAFVIDTVFVVGEVIGPYQPTTPSISGDDAFDHCVVRSLATLPPHLASATFTLYRGATIEAPIDGMFSFVPCRRRTDPAMRFARPTIVLPGIVNPRSTQAVAGAGRLRPLTEVAAAWREVVRQVRAADLLLGTQLATPHRGEHPTGVRQRGSPRGHEHE